MNENPPRLTELAQNALWFLPPKITPNNFLYKSLSNWSLNFAVGCSHACRFCYVPSSSTIKLGPKLRDYGVSDPDLEWGKYAVLRPWCERTFLLSLKAAEKLAGDKLKPDGNRAVMLSSTTDPYQIVRHVDRSAQKSLNAYHRWMVRRALELIRDNSNLNVRILTRSPLARLDFPLYATFGSRLLFGMSLPTLRDELAGVYEPAAPSPTARLKALRQARDAGLHTYVAMAPTYPESDRDDLWRTLAAIADIKPVTIFAEPINVRSQNVVRIAEAAARKGVALRTQVFADRETWRRYALESLRTVEELSKEMGMEQIHLWPDASLGNQATFRSVPNPADHQRWLQHWWSRISEWPGRSSLEIC